MGTTYFDTVDGEIIGESSGSTTINYATDALGSVTGTLVSGQLVNTYAYKPYGSLLAKTGTGADPKHGWNGSSGYRPTGRAQSDYYVRARHYGTSSGRWMAVDPLWPHEAAYVYLSPALLSDPSGADQDSPWCKYYSQAEDYSIIDVPFSIDGNCPDNVKRAVKHFCNMVKNGDLDSLWQAIDDCIQNASPPGLVCQHVNTTTLDCLKHFCRHGKVHCFRQRDDPEDTGYTLGCWCHNHPTERGEVYISDSNYKMGLDERSQNPTGVFIHEMLHACGMVHAYKGSSASDWEGAATTCNNIAACCVINIIFDKGARDTIGRRSVDHCMLKYNTAHALGYDKPRRRPQPRPTRILR